MIITNCSGPVRDLGPITNQAQIPHLAVYSQHTPSLRGGGRSNTDKFKQTVTSLYPCSREYITGGYTSHDFVTTEHTYSITTALHSHTSI